MHILFRTAACFAVLSLIFQGCVSTRTTSLANDGVAVPRGRTLAITKRAKPDFGAATAGKAMFGVIGAVAMTSAGNKIVADNLIEDPATIIADQLSEELRVKYELVAAEDQSVLVDTTDTQQLANLYANADLVLDVRTVAWEFLYRPNLTHYRVIYSVKVRLIDTHRRMTLAEAFCVRKDDDDKNPPTRDELLADQAALLKIRLRDDAGACASELATKILGTPPT